MMTKEDYLNEYKTHKSMRDNVKRDNYRLQYHLMPPTGFLNDPNGLFQKDGVYHIYFQYTPFTAGWGTKLWGHYTSKDMINFNQEEPFLYPDISLDRDGVYSGSAFVEDETIHYFYTGNVKLTDREDYDYINSGREQNTIHMTSKDGYKISEKELILSNDDYPIDMSKHVRDPKIFKKNNYYYMVLGGRTSDNQGCVLLYKSKDLINFEYYNRIEVDDFGYMWECPDLFELDGELFLVVWPQGISQRGYDYANVYQTGIPDAEYNNQPTVDYCWQHALTMPRVLSYKNNQIYQQPLDEMKNLRLEKIVSNCKNIKQKDTVVYEMQVDFDKSQDFVLQIRDDVQLSYLNHVLSLSLKQSGYGRSIRAVELNEVNSLTIYSDTSSLEIFINDGQEVFTTRLYGKLSNQNIEFLTENKGEVFFYPLKGYTIIKND